MLANRTQLSGTSEIESYTICILHIYISNIHITMKSNYQNFLKIAPFAYFCFHVCLSACLFLNIYTTNKSTKRTSQYPPNSHHLPLAAVHQINIINFLFKPFKLMQNTNKWFLYWPSKSFLCILSLDYLYLCL